MVQLQSGLPITMAQDFESHNWQMVNILPLPIKTLWPCSLIDGEKDKKINKENKN